jgi:purine-binding chemotaxis protein CheW
MELAPENMRPAPDVDSVIGSESVIGLGSLGDRMLILLDIEKLMSAEDMGLTVDLA